tara:strand:+ start:839 stop:1480 length:642 start_codon:yes stop_codon:yes gene_type:complete
MSRLIVSNIETQNIKFDSDTTAFTIGSDGIVTGNNAPAMVKLFEGSFGSSSGDGSITHYDIDSTYINSTYDAYDIIGYFRPSGDNRYLYMKLMTSGSVITSNHLGYEYLYAAGTHAGGGNTESSFGFQAFGSGTAEGRGTKLHARVSNVNNTSSPCSITASVNYMEHTGGAHQGSYMCGSMIDGQHATVINGFRFQFHTGNIHGGYVKIYGIK